MKISLFAVLQQQFQISEVFLAHPTKIFVFLGHKGPQSAFKDMKEKYLVHAHTLFYLL